MKRLFITLIIYFLIGCKGDSPQQQITESEGEFNCLTYNVAGLPIILNGRDPAEAMPLISPLLNNYDIALIQEDFFYHDLLKEQTTHPYLSQPKAEGNAFLSGDGLNRFSRFPFGGLTRITWTDCSDTSGFDCNAKKGFSIAETEISDGVKILVYNVHLDSGGEQGDITARAGQVEQLISDLKSRAANKAVVLAGDLNLGIDNRPDDLVLLNKLLNECELKDACREQNCGTELVDRVLFRSADNLELTLSEWGIDSSFVDENGVKLSDHFAVSVQFDWVVK